MWSGSSTAAERTGTEAACRQYLPQAARDTVALGTDPARRVPSAGPPARRRGHPLRDRDHRWPHGRPWRGAAASYWAVDNRGEPEGRVRSSACEDVHVAPRAVRDRLPAVVAGVLHHQPHPSPKRAASPHLVRKTSAGDQRWSLVSTGVSAVRSFGSKLAGHWPPRETTSASSSSPRPASHELVELDTLTPRAAAFLEASVRAGLNILVAGAASAAANKQRCCSSSGPAERRPSAYLRRLWVDLAQGPRASIISRGADR